MARLWSGRRGGEQAQGADGLRKTLEQLDVGEHDLVGVAVELADGTEAIRHGGPARRLEAASVNGVHAAEGDESVRAPEQRTDRQGEAHFREHLDAEQSQRGVQRECAEKILRPRWDAERGEEDELQTEARHEDRGEKIARGHRRTRAEGAPDGRDPQEGRTDAEPDHRVDEPREPHRAVHQPRGTLRPRDTARVVESGEQIAAEERREHRKIARAFHRILDGHGALGESRPNYASDRAEVEKMQDEKHRADAPERGFIRAKIRAVPPEQIRADRDGERQGLRMIDGQQDDAHGAQPQRPRALCLQKIREGREGERAHRDGETRVPQDAVKRDDVRRNDDRRGEPSAQAERAREPQQTDAREPRTEQTAQDHEGERVVREGEEQLIDLRGHRPVGDAEISKQSGVRGDAVLIEVKRVRDQPGLVDQPRDIARPKHDREQSCERQQPRQE